MTSYFSIALFSNTFLITSANHEGWVSAYAAMSVLSNTFGPFIFTFLILPTFEQNERIFQKQKGTLVGGRQRIASKNLSNNLHFVKVITMNLVAACLEMVIYKLYNHSGDTDQYMYLIII